MLLALGGGFYFRLLVLQLLQGGFGVDSQHLFPVKVGGNLLQAGAAIYGLLLDPPLIGIETFASQVQAVQLGRRFGFRLPQFG